MKKLLYCCCFIICLKANSQATISINDFNILNNTKWEGTLVYLDYQSGEESSVETKLQINIKDNTVIYNQQYTYEPKKNNVSKVKIKEMGTYFGNEKVENRYVENGKFIFITSYKGKDNGKRATMYVTRVFDSNELSVSKSVQYETSSELFVRNTYNYKRLKNE